MGIDRRAALIAMELSHRLLLAAASLNHRSRLLVSRLEITRYTVALPTLPAALEGLTVAHISDLHVGEGEWRPYYADEAAECLRREKPDIIVNTGDYLQGEPPIDHVMRLTSPFTPDERIDAPVYSILGNHDYYAEDPVIGDLSNNLRAAGVQLLVNQGACFARNGGQLSIVGLTHETGDLERGISVLQDATRPRIALIHEPDRIVELPYGSADLVLAGHTHGGQITVPGLTPIIVRRFGNTRFDAGFYYRNGMLMFINRGLGYTGLPFRYRARPEVTILRLVR